MSLLERFLTSDCDIDVREQLIGDINMRANAGASRREYTFNRFNVVIDFDDEIVWIEDDLDPSDGGGQSLPLSLFTEGLKTHGRGT